MAEQTSTLGEAGPLGDALGEGGLIGEGGQIGFFAGLERRATRGRSIVSLIEVAMRYRDGPSCAD
jgi:hypothetical protein